MERLSNLPKSQQETELGLEISFMTTCSILFPDLPLSAPGMGTDQIHECPAERVSRERGLSAWRFEGGLGKTLCLKFVLTEKH